MATEIDIVNGALAMLKAPRLTSMQDNSEAAAIIRLRYPVCRDAVLELVPWHFASVRKALARSGDEDEPVFDWRYQYTLPTQPWCIKVRDPDPVLTPWEVGYDPKGGGGRVLFSNNSTMKIRYTARIEDTSIWSPLAVDALTYRLASDLAMALTGDMGKAKGWREAYRETIGEAMSSDAQEGSPVHAYAPDILTAIR